LLLFLKVVYAVCDVVYLKEVCGSFTLPFHCPEVNNKRYVIVNAELSPLLLLQ